MTALKEFQRLEAAGLWRNGANAQRRDVIVSLGEATLTITDLQDRPLAHWSLAAIVRKNPGAVPAVFYPDGDQDETLELAANETTMLEAIDKLRGALDRARPRPGRLRSLGIWGTLAATLAGLVIWGPNALQSHATRVVPEVNRKAIGQSLLKRIERLSGQTCRASGSAPLLARIAQRTGVEQLLIVREGVTTSLALPGGLILLNRSFIEDPEDPDVAAGAILAERIRAEAQDPLYALLNASGLKASVQLLTTGTLNEAILDAYAEATVAQVRPTVDEDRLLAAFVETNIASSPYAYAIDKTGETTLGLIEFDPMTHQETQPVLTDQQWVALQNICG